MFWRKYLVFIVPLSALAQEPLTWALAVSLSQMLISPQRVLGKVSLQCASSHWFSLGTAYFPPTIMLVTPTKRQSNFNERNENPQSCAGY